MSIKKWNYGCSMKWDLKGTFAGQCSHAVEVVVAVLISLGLLL